MDSINHVLQSRHFKVLYNEREEEIRIKEFYNQDISSYYTTSLIVKLHICMFYNQDISSYYTTLALLYVYR